MQGPNRGPFSYIFVVVNLYILLNILGAFALFIYGMKVMSEAVQKIAGRKLRSVLSAIASNKYSALFTGFLVTSVIQSSSAVTVMVVSFVNAGMLGLTESIYLILGANIGTTATSWLVYLLGIGQLSLSSIALPIIGFGVMLYLSRSNSRSLAEAFIGFGLLFLGIALLKQSLPNVESSEGIKTYLGSFGQGEGHYFPDLWRYMVFILIGFLVSVILQSSSVAMAFTLVLTSEGLIDLPMGMALVIGENIGTTITANIAALIANVHAKRAARAHFIFNLFGAGWMLFFLPFFVPFVSAIGESITKTPEAEFQFYAMSLAAFHTSFNVVNVAIFLLFGLTEQLTIWLIKWVPSKVASDEEYHLEYFGGRMMQTSELSIIEVRNELTEFVKHIQKAYSYLPKILLEPDEKAQEEYLSRIELIEKISDKMELDIADYLSKVSQNEVSNEASQRIRNVLSASNYLERISDLILKIAIFMVRRKKEKAYFTPELRRNLIQFMEIIQKALLIMTQNVQASQEKIDLDGAKRIEREINEHFRQLKSNYLKAMELNKYKIQSGLYYHDLINELERVADHIESVSEALSGMK